MLLSALALAASLAATACGSSPRGANDDREDAVAYLRAAERFQAAQSRAGGSAFVRVRDGLGHCPPRVGGSRRRLVTSEVEEFLVPVRGQATLPDFRRLSDDLGSVDAHDTGLREIASAAATVAREDAKLGRPVLDICRFLGAWRAAGWSPSFPDAYYVRLCGDAGYAANAVARAEDRIQKRVVELGRLGLSPRQQLDLYTSLLSPLFAVCNVVR